MKQYTQWLSYDEKKQAYVHNHIEEGWTSVRKPVPMHPNQEVWKTMKWASRYVWLDENMKEVEL